MAGENWAVVLAAGEGKRLRPLTPIVPKQFCTLSRGPSLLGLALDRAAEIVPRERIAAIVAADHEAWWRREPGLTNIGCVVIQPEDRGTGAGVLLSLLHVLERDASARVLFLPSDHFVADESRLAGAMRRALVETATGTAALVLVGVVPDDPDAQLGWIVPEQGVAAGCRLVERFVEKPPREVAADLMRQGGLWNSFIFAAHGASLLDHCRARHPEAVFELESALATGAHGEALRWAYRDLERFDFSRDVLQGLEASLRVLTVTDCGWSDLGTPDRVVRCMESLLRCGRAAGTGTGVDLVEAVRAWIASTVGESPGRSQGSSASAAES